MWFTGLKEDIAQFYRNIFHVSLYGIKIPFYIVIPSMIVRGIKRLLGLERKL